MIEHRDSKKRDAKRREKEQSSSAGGSAKDSKKEGRDIVLFPKSPDNLFDWTAFIDGPKDTPYEGGRFQLRLQIPNRYPLKPPIVHFVTKVCHPNVLFRTGEICLNILKDQWSPVCTLEMMCISIMNLLYAPEASSPLNCDAGTFVFVFFSPYLPARSDASYARMHKRRQPHSLWGYSRVQLPRADVHGRVRHEPPGRVRKDNKAKGRKGA